jgi:hypothetical protein
MRTRLRYFAILGATVGVVGITGLKPVDVAGQAPAAGAALRTAWGAPDLQGIWQNQQVAPLERPKELGAKEFFTEEERVAQDKRRADQAVRNTNIGRDRRGRTGTEQDVAGAYNAIWQGGGDSAPRRTARRTSQIVDPPDGRLPPRTAESKQQLAARRDYLNMLLMGSVGSAKPGPPASAAERAKNPPDYNLDRMNRADGPEDRSASERCLGNNLPQIGTMQRIVQSADAVSIYYDIGQGQGFSRIIPIGATPHLPSNVRQQYGDARGRWEGDTLVVDITNFTHYTSFRGSRENLHLTERFKRLDANTLEYRVTIEDPTTWTKPWTVVVEMSKQDDKPNQIYQQTCHEGNYGMVGMLSNSRAAELLFKEGKGSDPATQDIATGGGSGDENGDEQVSVALPGGVGRNPIPEDEK